MVTIASVGNKPALILLIADLSKIKTEINKIEKRKHINQHYKKEDKDKGEYREECKDKKEK